MDYSTAGIAAEMEEAEDSMDPITLMTLAHRFTSRFSLNPQWRSPVRWATLEEAQAEADRRNASANRGAFFATEI